jgi:hypothetical protein
MCQLNRVKNVRGKIGMTISVYECSVLNQKLYRTKPNSFNDQLDLF